MSNNQSNSQAALQVVKPPPAFLSLNQFYDDNFECNWLIQNIIENDTTGVLYGKSGAYKSFMALDMALCVASGLAWHGHKITRFQNGVVVYVAGEGHKGIKKRALAWQAKHNVPLGNFYLYNEKLQILNKPFSNGEYDYERDLFAQFSDNLSEIEQPIDLIIFDTLRKTFGRGDENSTIDMGEYIDKIEQIKVDHGTTTMVIHHTNKSNQIRGSNALQSDVDYCYLLKSNKQQTATLICEKLKDAEPPYPLHFEMVEQEAENNHGTSFKSLVPVMVKDGVRAAKKPPSGIKGLMYQHIKEHCIEPTTWTDVISQILAKKQTHEGKDLTKGNLRTAIKGLQKTHENDFIFVDDDAEANTIQATGKAEK